MTKEKVRVNVIRKKLDNAIYETWMPVLEKYGIDSMIIRGMCEYAHMHSLLESAIHIPQVQNPIGDKFALNLVQPNVQLSALPIFLKIISGVDRLRDMRLCTTDAPMFQVLIGDSIHVVEVDSVVLTVNVPAVDVMDANTNLIEIYEDRIIEQCQQKLDDYLGSVENADSVVMYMADIFMHQTVGDDFRSGMTMGVRFRLKAYNDETFDPALKGKRQDDKPETVKAPELQSVWVMELGEEPGRFKKWLAKIIFGKCFVRLRKDNLKKVYTE